jgi:hypothetical protein
LEPRRSFAQCEAPKQTMTLDTDATEKPDRRRALWQSCRGALFY